MGNKSSNEMINCDDHLPNPSNFPSFPNYNGFLIEPAANVFKIPFECS